MILRPCILWGQTQPLSPTWATNLDKLDFLVVQELMLTETAQRADVVLPGLSWAEQDGTFTNLERRAACAQGAGNPHTKAALTG